MTGKQREVAVYGTEDGATLFVPTSRYPMTETREAPVRIESHRVDIIENGKAHDHEWRDRGDGYAECECGAFGTLDWKWPR